MQIHYLSSQVFFYHCITLDLYLLKRFMTKYTLHFAPITSVFIWNLSKKYQKKGNFKMESLILSVFALFSFVSFQLSHTQELVAFDCSHPNTTVCMYTYFYYRLWISFLLASFFGGKSPMCVLTRN